MTGVQTCALPIYVIRASVFLLYDDGIIETGDILGFPSEPDRGNLRNQNSTITISRYFNMDNHDNGNYIFTAKGINSATWNQTNQNYCYEDDLDASYGHLERITITQGATQIFQSNSLTTENLTYRYYPDQVINLVSGNNYTMDILIDGTSNPSNYYCSMWIDTSYNAVFETAERFPTGNPVRVSAGSTASISFSIPSSVRQGTTQLRIIVRNNSGQIGNSCNTSGYGETEDFTVNISNPTNIFSQVTGGSVPAQVKSIAINAVNSASRVDLSQNISISDTLTINSGTFYPG